MKEALFFADECREGKKDSLLIQKPGKDRGAPVWIDKKLRKTKQTNGNAEAVIDRIPQGGQISDIDGYRWHARIRESLTLSEADSWGFTDFLASTFESWLCKEATHDSSSLYPGIPGLNALLSLYLPLRTTGLSLWEGSLFRPGLRTSPTVGGGPSCNPGGGICRLVGDMHKLENLLH